MAYFLAESAGVFQAVPGKEIKWPAGAISPPPDEPLCGFYNEKNNCNQSEGKYVIAILRGRPKVTVEEIYSYLVTTQSIKTQELSNL